MNHRHLLPVLLAAHLGVAVAQSSVTVFGTLDVSARYVKADGQARMLSEAVSGLNSSQLGFRGTEDLGDGLSAGFTLLTELFPDSGTTGVGTKFWNRRSTVSLVSKRFGELRLGRDYTPTFWTQGIFDAFGIVGLGSSSNSRQLYGGTRMDNAIGYILPSDIGGVYGQAMIAAAEGGATLDRPARYVGARFGYANGPLDIAVSFSRQRYGAGSGAGTTGTAAAVAALSGDTQQTVNVGMSWDFGPVKLLGYIDRETLNSARESMYSVSAIVPVGVGEIHVGYDRNSLKVVSSTTVDQVKASYVHALSKRTSLYATASELRNKDATRITLSGAAGPTRSAGKSVGTEFGIRHFF